MIYKYKYIIYTDVLECICPVKHLKFFFFLNPQIILLHGGCESRCTILFTGRTRGDTIQSDSGEKKKLDAWQLLVVSLYVVGLLALVF